jgi:L,D-transpeptidase YcbB
MIDPTKPAGRQSRALRQQELVTVPLRSAPRIITRTSPAATPLLALLCGFLSICPGVHAEPPPAPAGIATSAAVELPWLNSTTAPVIAGETLAQWTALRSFYSLRQNRPAWLTGNTPTADAKLLIDMLSAADKEGLRPADYHIPVLTTGQLPANERELLLTDAALRYAHDQLTGRFEPRQMDPAWFIAPPVAPDIAGALQTALESHQLAQWLDTLPPPHPAYAQLRTALAHYRELAAQAPWPTIEDGPALKPGAHDARVPVLRQRLERSGELAHDETGDATLYDGTLAGAVRTFQLVQGLEADGVVGKATRAALNVSIQQRVHQLQANMERWRWLPRQFESPYIRVNMAGFELQVEEHDKPVLSMHVIVGKQLLSTPAFNSRITHIIFNPYWIVPQSIASKEILPILKQDPDYLSRENLQVFDSRSAGAQPIDPADIDWSQYTQRHFPFRLRQRPGPHNSLGQVKFLLPNPYDIYLHDTPSRRLFDKSVRALSHGCIRIQKPNELAEYLLRGSAKWNPEAIAAAIARQVTHTVTLPQSTSVYMLYFTAWVDSEGVVQFRDDIYARDVKLAQTFENVN